MSNPASELADIYDAWRTPRNKNAAELQKAYAQSRDLTHRQVVSRAMHCLLEIEAALTRLRAAGTDVAIYETKYRQWQAGITRVPHGSTSQDREPLSKADTEHLRTFATLLDLHAATLAVDSETFARVRTAVDSIRADLDNLELPAVILTYANALLDALLEGLERGDASEFESKLAEFLGWTVIHEEASADVDRKSKFAALRHTLLYPLLTGVVGNAITAGVTKLLGM